MVVECMLTKFYRKVSPTFLAATFLSLNIFVFGPATVYTGNPSEFQSSFFDNIYLFIFCAAAFILVISILSLFLKTHRLSLYNSLIIIIAILLWLQGNILLWDYGVFDGRDIDWSKNNLFGILDISI